MKVQGISQQKSKAPVEPFVKNASKPVHRIWGRTFDGEEELHDLWDSGEIIQKVTPLPLSRTEQTEQPAPFAGLTELEKVEESLGYKPNLAYATEAANIRRGFGQPTSKGIKHVEANVLQMRKKYEVT